MLGRASRIAPRNLLFRLTPVRRLRGLLLSMVPCLAACAGPYAATQAPAETNSLRVLAFNVWQEGTKVEGGFEKIIDILLAADADVIALSEIRNYQGVDWLERAKQALRTRGETYHGDFVAGDVGVLSRWPIARAETIFFDPAKARGSLVGYWLQNPAGGELFVASAHLDYKNYAIYLPRGYDGNTFKIIDPDGDGEPNPVTDLERLHAMDEASGRDDILEAFVAFTNEQVDAETPIILAGDFNECSHLDWTAATRDLYSHNGVAIEWRNSRMLAEHGFRDTWRERHPDPVTHPGATWPSEAWKTPSTSWTPKVDERDRIDFIYLRDPTKTWSVRNAAIAGSPRYYVFDTLRENRSACPFALRDLPWPSDHKGVLVDFEY